MDQQLTKKLIRLVADELYNDSKGVLTTQGVILEFDRAIKELEYAALRTPIQNYLDNVES